MPDYLPRPTALEVFKRALPRGNVILTDHISERMQEKNFDMNDVIHLKGKGSIFKEPERDKTSGEWKYIIEGRDVEGKPLSILFNVLDNGRVKLVTGWR